MRLNLLNSTTDNATYAYGSLLTTDALYTMCKSGAPPPAAVCANGVMDYIYHPIEPLSFRLTLSGPLESIGTIDFPAMAAELRRSIAVKPVHPDNYDWTGFYIGAHVDSAWSKISNSTVNAVTGAARGRRQHYDAVARRPAARLRRNVADTYCGRHCGRRVVRQHHDDNGRRCLRHQRGANHGVRQRNRARAAWLRLR